MTDDDDIPNGVWRIDGDTRVVLRLARAREALAQGNALAASVEAEELLDEHPDQADALSIAGDAAIELGHSEVAAAAFEHCVRLGLASAAVMEGLAVARFDLCDLEGAATAARDALQQAPDSARAHYFLGEALARTAGRTQESSDHLAAAHRIDPERFTPPLALGQAEWEKALTRALLRLEADVAEFWLDVPVRWEELPELAELRAHEPPIRPTVGGLYVGTLPLDADPHRVKPEALRLFRGNLAQAADRDEVVENLVMLLEDEADAWLSLQDYGDGLDAPAED